MAESKSRGYIPSGGGASRGTIVSTSGKSRGYIPGGGGESRGTIPGSSTPTRYAGMSNFVAGHSQLAVGHNTGGSGFLGGVSSVLGGLEDVGTSVLFGLAGTGEAMAHDVRDLGVLHMMGIPQVGILRQRHNLFRHPGQSETVQKVAAPIVHSYAYKYGPAFHGDFGETAHRAGEDKLGTLLDAAAIVTLPFTAGGSASIRGAALATRVGRIGELGERYAAWTARAPLREAELSGASGTYGQRILRTRAVGTGEQIARTSGGPADLVRVAKAARTPHWRAVQAISDRVSRLISPEPYIGGWRVPGLGRLSTEQRIVRGNLADTVAQATARERMLRGRFLRHLSRLTAAEAFAFHYIVQHYTPEEARGMMLGEEATHVLLAGTQRRMPWAVRATRKRYVANLDRLGDEAAQIIKEGGKAHPRLLAAVEMGREVADAAGWLLEEQGKLTPMQRERRAYAPMRVVRGARYGAPRKIKGELVTPELGATHERMRKDIEGWEREAIKQAGEARRLEARGGALRSRIPRDRSDQMAHELQSLFTAHDETLAERERQLLHLGTTHQILTNARRALHDVAGEGSEEAKAELRDAARMETIARNEWNAAYKHLEAAKRYEQRVWTSDLAFRGSTESMSPRKWGELQNRVLHAAERLYKAQHRLERAELDYSASMGRTIGAHRHVARLEEHGAAVHAAMADRAAQRRIYLAAEKAHASSVANLRRAEQKWLRYSNMRQSAVDRHAAHMEEHVLPARQRALEARERAQALRADIEQPDRYGTRPRRMEDIELPGGFEGGISHEEARAIVDKRIMGGDPEWHESWGEPYRMPHIGPRNRGLAKQPVGVGAKADGTTRVRDPVTLRVFKATRMLTATLIHNPAVLGEDLLKTMRWYELGAFQREYDKLAVPIELTADGDVPLGMAVYNPDGVHIPREIQEWSGHSEAWRSIERGVGDAKAHVDAVKRAVGEVIPELQDEESIRAWLAERGRPLAQEAHTVRALQEAGLKMIPEYAARSMRAEMRGSEKLGLQLFDRTLDVWRALVLQWRPAWLVYNIVGQHLLYGLHYAGLNGMRAYVDALKREKGISDPDDPRLRKLATLLVRHEGRLRNIVERTPGAEELLQGGPGAALMQGSGRGYALAELQNPLVRNVRRAGHVANFPGRLAQHLNLTIADDLPRLAAFRAEVSKMPQYRQLERQVNDWHGIGGQLKRALDQMLPGGRALGLRRESRTDTFATFVENLGRTDPELIRHLVSRVDDALGNFKRLSPFERNVIRRVVPFYSWYKLITTMSLRLAVDDPVRVNLIKNLEQAIAADPSHSMAGPMPSYSDVMVAEGRPKDGVQTGVATLNVNPFATIKQEVHAIRHTGEEGGFGSESALSMVGPWLPAGLQAAGIDPFYGGQYTGPGSGNIVTRTLAYSTSFPQARLLRQIAGTRKQGIDLGPVHVAGYKSTLYANDWKDYVLNYLGLPIKRVRLDEARTRAEAGQ